MTRTRLDRLSAALVWTVWAGMLAVALVAIARYGPQIPRAEDWYLVPPLTGHAPTIGGWLWAQNSEHRVPLPQLAYLILLKATGGDFRAGMVFDTLALAGLAAAMMLAARRLRGRSSLVDAFFPLVLLHLGHWDNLVWSWQIQFVLSTLAAGIFLLVIVSWRDVVAPPRAALAALCLVALPLCGANGLVLAPFLALWAAYSARRAPRRSAVLLSTGVVAAAAIVAVYFIGYERATWYPDSSGPSVTARMAAQFLTMAFGPGVSVSWRVLVGVTLLLAVATVVLLVVRLRSADADSRQRMLGLLCVVSAMVLLAVALAWGRAGRAATTGLSRRYALLAVPLLCAVFFAWQLYGPRRWATGVQAALLLIEIGLVPANTRAGLAARDWVESGMSAVRRDVATGMPTPLLAERHRSFLLHWDGERLAAGMRMLAHAGIAPFAGLPDDFAVEEISVADTRDGIVRLPEPRRIYAIRLQTTAPAGESISTDVRVAWQAADARVRLEVVSPPTRDEPAGAFRTVWVNDVMESFRIEAPDRARLDGLRLWLLSAQRAETPAPRHPGTSPPAQAEDAEEKARQHGLESERGERRAWDHVPHRMRVVQSAEPRHAPLVDGG